MRKSGILNISICREIAALKHTEYLVIADPGLPVPENVPVIDISLVQGIPSFCEAVDAVLEELVVDSYTYADEMNMQSGTLAEYLDKKMSGIPKRIVPHEELKRMLANAKVIIRTGECTPYANVILEGGVNF